MMRALGLKNNWQGNVGSFLHNTCDGNVTAIEITPPVKRGASYRSIKNPRKIAVAATFEFVIVNDKAGKGFITPRSAVRSRPPLPTSFFRRAFHPNK